ncbi:MAG: hypothetical protein ACLTXL_15460 [Clostridia bacterium]
MTIRNIEETDVPVLAEFEREIAVISFGDSAVVDVLFHQKKIRKAMQRGRERGCWSWRQTVRFTGGCG